MSTDYSYLSPNGQFGFAIHAWEVRMSLWIESPALIEILTKRKLLTFTDVNWSLDTANWESNTVVTLTLRKYPGDHRPADFKVHLDCASEMARVDDGDNVSLDEVEAMLAARYHKCRQI